MNLASVAAVQGGALQAAVRQWDVITPVAQGPLRFFRQVIYLRFAVGSIADGVSIDADTTTLEADFQPYEYDARLSNSSLAASLTPSVDNKALIVELDAPRQALRVQLRAGRTVGSKQELEFYRVDGKILAEQATVTVSMQNAAATLTEEFTDIRFALQLKGAGGSSLTASDIEEIHIRSYPTGPRFGVANPDDLLEQEEALSVAFFWQEPGELRDADQRHVAADKAFAVGLQRYLDAYFDALSVSSGTHPSTDHVDVALVVESDAPCRLNVSAFNIGYHAVVRNFFSAGLKVGKQVLRFAGNQFDTQEVPVLLPRNAQVSSATLQTIESFKPDRVATSNGSGLPAGTPSEKTGVYIGVEKWVAQGVTPTQAVSASGIALGLLPLANQTELQVELKADWRGEPSGKTVVEGIIALEQAGQRNWVMFLFPKPITLPAQLHWILLKAARGHAIWLAKPGGTPVRVLESSSQMATWTESNVLTGLEALYWIFSRNQQTKDQPLAPPVTLAIGSATVTGVSVPNDTRTFNLKAALNAYLAQSPSSDAVLAVPLTFAAATPGLITVHPPHIEYDI